jgi:hypothetical protein
MPRQKRTKIRRSNKPAQTVLQLLQDKHVDDVFIAECKNGPTHIATDLLVLDAWVMKKSWTNPLTIGYEIKTARGDFLQDTKWQGYLKWCNEFYFVAPYGVVTTDELPPEVGLIWCSKNMTRLLTKRKAVYRELEIGILDDLFRYVLMNRARITRDQSADNADYWQQWLEEKDAHMKLGRAVSKRLNEVLHEEVDAVARENRRLKDRIDELEETRELLKELGVDKEWISSYAVRCKVEELQRTIPKDLEPSITHTISQLERFREQLQELRGDSSGQQ